MYVPERGELIYELRSFQKATLCMAGDILWNCSHEKLKQECLIQEMLQLMNCLLLTLSARGRLYQPPGRRKT
jgi:hypothetical protein